MTAMQLFGLASALTFLFGAGLLVLAIVKLRRLRPRKPARHSAGYAIPRAPGERVVRPIDTLAPKRVPPAPPPPPYGHGRLDRRTGQPLTGRLYDWGPHPYGFGTIESVEPVAPPRPAPRYAPPPEFRD